MAVNAQLATDKNGKTFIVSFVHKIRMEELK